MKRILTVLVFLLSCTHLFAAEDTAKRIIWGFPITDYIVPLNMSDKNVQVVQVKLPSNIRFIKDKQLGVLRGAARGTSIDTGMKGYGKCHLIKGAYYYFTIFMDSNATAPKQGDMLYTFLPRETFGYISPLLNCAAHGVTFRTVTDTAFYKPDDFLKKRTQAQDEALLQRMVRDIRYTGDYFLKEDSSRNMLIPDGTYKGHHILDIMSAAGAQDLTEFLRYVAARPRRYAGNDWKISETFATWLLHGAPMVVHE
jgi:hypothetical protein